MEAMTTGSTQLCSIRVQLNYFNRENFRLKSLLYFFIFFLVTHDMRLVIHDLWHVTCDMWHVICDTWQLGEDGPSVKIQLLSSYGTDAVLNTLSTVHRNNIKNIRGPCLSCQHTAKICSELTLGHLYSNIKGLNYNWTMLFWIEKKTFYHREQRNLNIVKGKVQLV